MAAAAAVIRMDDVQWPKALNNVITKRWTQLKNTLVMKDIVDHLIQRRVVTLDYWMGLKSKPITESERMEDFLSLVLKFDQQKFNYFLEALLHINRQDLVRQLMKCQDVKQIAGKPRSSDKNSIKLYENSRMENSDKKRIRGQTDCDDIPATFDQKLKVDEQKNKSDGHNGSLESSKVKQTINKAQNKRKAPVPEQSETSGTNSETLTVEQEADLSLKKPATPEVLLRNQTNVIPIDTRTQTRGSSSPERKNDKKITKTKDIPKAVKATGNKVGIADIQSESLKESDIGKSSTSFSSDLTEKEEQLRRRETALKQREIKLQEQEERLLQKETELLTRENSMVSNMTKQSELGPLPVHRQLHNVKFEENSNPATATTTQSTDVFADIREQLAALKREQEIESEHTTSFGFNKDEFVKVEDFHAVQVEVEELKEEIKTDRSERENMQSKVEGMKHEIESLKSTIKTLKIEKQTDKSQLDKEVNRLKNELKNSKETYNDAVNKIRADMKEKENECERLKGNLKDIKQNHEELDKRVVILENEKQKFELEILKYDKEVSELKIILEQKETQLIDLRKALDDTEVEKEDLAEEVTGLKTEVARLKAERKRLEQEKKTLLGRCVKPQWNSSTTRSSAFK